MSMLSNKVFVQYGYCTFNYLRYLYNMHIVQIIVFVQSMYCTNGIIKQKNGIICEISCLFQVSVWTVT